MPYKLASLAKDEDASYMSLLPASIKDRSQCYASLHCNEYGHLKTWHIYRKNENYKNMLSLYSMCFHVSSINLKENKRTLEIPRTLNSCCLRDCRTIELSDYRAIGLAIGSPLTFFLQCCNN